jgi:hypothetical protein
MRGIKPNSIHPGVMQGMQKFFRTISRGDGSENFGKFSLHGLDLEK